ncbi:MAG: lipo-like protein, partial [Alphaproteobacteria bacterium]|nr:lipo-like protein [Alphaproteobacteria bacterium]
MTALNKLLDWTGRRIANRVTKSPDPKDAPHHTDISLMQQTLRPGDVILVDGRDKVSAAIRYLTQSSWSHSALYVGDALDTQTDDGERHTLIEVNLGDGCVSAPLSKYKHYPTRICRPVNLTEDDRHRLVTFMCENLGLTYDTRNVFDLVRYLVPSPPIPRRFRRRMIALGSGSPTRAICSTLIAQAFQTIRYP